MNCLVGKEKATGMRGVADERGRRSAGHEISRLEATYSRHAAPVYTLCLRLLADVRDAEEATVRAFVRFGGEPARACDEPRDLGRLRELGVDESLRRLRARRLERPARRAAVRASPPAPQAVQPPTTRGGPASFRAPLDAAALDALAARLPDDLRAAFVLRDYEGLSDGEVAARLHVDGPEARRLIHQARTELRRLRLEQEEDPTR